MKPNKSKLKAIQKSNRRVLRQHAVQLAKHERLIAANARHYGLVASGFFDPKKPA